jgi:hypothetical protein
MTPFIVLGCVSQMKANSPAVDITTDSESAFSGSPELKPAVALATEWKMSPFQLKLIVLPAGTVMRLGENWLPFTTLTSTVINGIGVGVSGGGGGCVAGGWVAGACVELEPGVFVAGGASDVPVAAGGGLASEGLLVAHGGAETGVLGVTVFAGELVAVSVSRSAASEPPHATPTAVMSRAAESMT